MSRILLFLYHGGYLRHYGEPVRILAGRGHQVTVALGRFEKDPGDRRLVDELLASTPGVEVVQAPARGRDDPYRAFAWMTRSLADLSRYGDPRYADAQPLRDRIAERIDGHLGSADVDRVTAAVGRRIVRFLTRRHSARTAALAGRFFLAVDDGIPPSDEVTRFVAERAPDAVAASPVVELGSGQVEFLKSAQALGIPTAVCIASWDNLTNKGLMRVVPDRVVVWNDVQVREAVELHRIPRERVVTTGAQRFDWWFGRGPARDRETFLGAIGLDPAQPYLLYVCSSPFIAPDEVSAVQRWLHEIRAHEELRDVGVLVRPHPQHAAQWESADLSGFGRVAVFPRGGAQADDEPARDDYFDSLYHCAAVVGVNTSAQVEAAILEKPVLTISFGETAATQDGTLHFRHLLWENGGNVRRSRSFDEHARELVAALSASDADRAHIRAFAASFIRPHGFEVAAAPLVADALEQLAQLPRRAPRRPGRLAPLVRLLARLR